MISIVIVSYNVRTFLEQTLQSVKRSVGASYEVIVVDNASSDDSCDKIRATYPWVTLIENKENVGFSRANNQGIALAKGAFILLLNPDTILAEDTLQKCSDFMQKKPDAGALGVRMIDGTGIFLPESKRGLPTPLVSFYKIFGLSALFPHSKKFGTYHLKYLSDKENHEVDVLSGAFMFMRKEALDKAGLLDETFFMYGEDIDLSYRIQLAGYKNYYLAETEIIHYKGESTKKNSIRYVKVFYQAMLIFFTKHFGFRIGFFQRAVITSAVYIRASLALLKRGFLFSVPMAIDFLILYATYFGVTRYWEEYNKWVEGGAYPMHYFSLHLTLYAALLVTGRFLAGNYQKRPSVKQSWRGAFMGGVLLLLTYALLPESERYSRAILVLGAFIGLGVLSLLRHLYFVWETGSIVSRTSDSIRVAVVGNEHSVEKARQLYAKTGVNKSLLGYIQVNTQGEESLMKPLSDIESLPLAISLFEIDELVFDAECLGNKAIITLIQTRSLTKVKIGILPPGMLFIVKSYHKNTRGEVESEEIKRGLQLGAVRRKKRITDLVLCIVLLPKLFFNKAPLMQDWLAVFKGDKTWIGFSDTTLAISKPFIIDLAFLVPIHSISINAITMHYVFNYHWLKDLGWVWNYYNKNKNIKLR